MHFLYTFLCIYICICICVFSAHVRCVFVCVRLCMYVCVCVCVCVVCPVPVLDQGPVWPGEPSSSVDKFDQGEEGGERGVVGEGGCLVGWGRGAYCFYSEIKWSFFISWWKFGSTECSRKIVLFPKMFSILPPIPSLARAGLLLVDKPIANSATLKSRCTVNTLYMRKKNKS